MPDLTVGDIKDQLRLSVEGQNFGVNDNQPPTAGACATYRREVNLQYRFMVYFQVLVGVLGALALLLLGYAAYQNLRTDGNGANATLAGAGALVTGAGALFLLRLRKDSRDRYDAATQVAALCP